VALHNALRFQYRESLPHRSSADPKLLRQLIFSGEPLAFFQPAVNNLALNLIYNLITDTHRPDILKQCHPSVAAERLFLAITSQLCIAKSVKLQQDLLFQDLLFPV
jgi:hypothetical protein